MEVRKISGGVIINEGKMLLIKRRHEPNKNTWCPPGGFTDKSINEPVEDCCIREIKEETGIDVEIMKLIGHKEIINVPGNYHRMVFFHLAKPKHTNIVPSDDISKAGFFSLQEIKKMKIAESVEWALRKAGFWK